MGWLDPSPHISAMMEWTEVGAFANANESVAWFAADTSEIDEMDSRVGFDSGHLGAGVHRRLGPCAGGTTGVAGVGRVG